MKRNKETKQGISLIVLVITIIVMIILATAVVLTLSNSGIISKANDAVSATDLANMQDLATMLWADAYLDGKSGDDLVDAVQDGLYAVDENYESKYDVLITDSGVTVKIKEIEEDDEENTENENETITQLSKPTITLSENTLVIVDAATNGSNTAGYEIYVGSEKKDTVTTTTYDLTTLGLTAGTYSITVKAIATEGSTIVASEPSEAVVYTVAEESKVPTEWQAYVSEITEDGVPIPKGFVASPYGADETNGISAENTKAGGLVIYELNDKDITKEDQFTSWTTRNQYVWVPVDNFEKQFVRKDFINATSKVVTTEGKYNALGATDVYWEVIIDEATKLPKTTLAEQSETFMSPETLTEVQAMYASVKKYGGFYIARYEAGLDDANWRKSSTAIVETLTNVHSKMNKIPYNYIKWSSSTDMKVDTGGAVQVARSLYTSKTTDANYSKYGVVSTLTYGVQWDRVIDWYVSTGAMSEAEVTQTTGSTSKGNYKDHDIASYTELNKDARFTTSGTTAFGPVTDKYTKGSSTTDVSHILTTGALKAAKINNIYDMAGNMYEWTMEGNAATYRVLRGGYYDTDGAGDPVSRRGLDNPNHGIGFYGFRSSLYIK